MSNPIEQEVYASLIRRLREPVDQGGYDGFSPDPLCTAAAQSIEELAAGLASQIDRLKTWERTGDTLRAALCEAVEALGPLTDAKVRAIADGNEPSPQLADGDTYYARFYARPSVGGFWLIGPTSYDDQWRLNRDACRQEHVRAVLARLKPLLDAKERP